MKQNLPHSLGLEPFSGFGITDDEVGFGPYRLIAIEVKHVFESFVADADEVNEECFLEHGLQQVLLTFVTRPTHITLYFLLAASPVLYPAIVEITRLVSPSLLSELPVVG